jgi:hypothetical protein|tara:strand:+ start:611 stop:913 length:303 start_codon:yes stop_codon:yes gene_type:complete
MKIYVDIDETICFYTGIREYSLATPEYSNIAKVNKLYDEGNEITYYTARGSLLKDRLDEFIQLTRNQLKEWNCKYHFLSIGEKPAYDLLICDKTKRIEEL